MNTQDGVPGVLIAFEGIDGAGKSTQLRLLARWLEGQGCRVRRSEWDSSELVMAATLRGKNRQLLTPTTYSLIHATDFADRYERQILPLLKGGYIVLADRYIHTSFAHDGVRGCDPQWLKTLYSFARMPDITLLFQLPIHAAITRTLGARQRAPLRFFEAGMDLGLSNDLIESHRIYQGRIAEIYQRLLGEYEFEVVDASTTIHRQQQSVRQILAAHIELARFQEREKK